MSTKLSNEQLKEASLTPQQQQANISVLPKKDASGAVLPGTVDGVLVRIRLFDDRERVLFFKVSTFRVLTIIGDVSRMGLHRCLLILSYVFMI